VLVIHDIGLFQGEPYIVSELLQGATLRKRLDGKPLPPAKTIDWALQLAQGLRARPRPLRHCTLIWGSDSLWTACRAPK